MGFNSAFKGLTRLVSPRSSDNHSRYVPLSCLWTDRVKNEEVVHIVMEERNILRTVKNRLTGLVTYCIITEFSHTSLKGRSEGKTRKKL